MLHVYPEGVRTDQIMPWGGPKDSGVTGDPTKATAEIGRMGIEFKVNAGINQYRLLKEPATARGRKAGAVGLRFAAGLASLGGPRLRRVGLWVGARFAAVGKGRNVFPTRRSAPTERRRPPGAAYARPEARPRGADRAH